MSSATNEIWNYKQKKNIFLGYSESILFLKNLLADYSKKKCLDNINFMLSWFKN